VAKACSTLIFRLFDFLAAYALRQAAYWFFPEQLSTLLLAITRLDARPVDIPDDTDLDVLVRALVAAEDRRFFSHHGVDSRGIARAATLLLASKRIQGASTITQQMVRVLTNDYRYSAQRKFKEMCLACVVDREISKKTQVALYLRIAYFGWRMNGIGQAWRRLHLSSPLAPSSAAAFVARLRYPEPRESTSTYVEKLNQRTRYIVAIMNR
jgi:membrane carboxypeptidase/penicillin-binding protein